MPLCYQSGSTNSNVLTRLETKSLVYKVYCTYPSTAVANLLSASKDNTFENSEGHLDVLCCRWNTWAVSLPCTVHNQYYCLVQSLRQVHQIVDACWSVQQNIAGHAQNSQTRCLNRARNCQVWQTCLLCVTMSVKSTTSLLQMSLAVLAYYETDWSLTVH